jgi:splicing factor 3B subunit 3
MSGALNEVENRFFRDSEIACLDIGEVPEGRQRCRFLAVCYTDKTVKILSLDPESCLSRISVLGLPAHPESVSLITFNKDDTINQS